ncbi:MAG: nitroreductase family protein, partial [Thermoleophilia bacterium]
MTLEAYMDANEAIRLRRSVRSYTDQPVDEKDISEILRLALLAPTGGMAQAWSFIVVRDAELRAAVAEIVIRGGAKYFETVRPAGPDVSADEHAEWARGYAEQVLGNYRHVPVWIVGLVVPRHAFPDDQAEWERVADLVSVGFAMENLMVAARARGLGTVPTVFHWYAEDDFRALLDIPAEMEIPVITP